LAALHGLGAVYNYLRKNWRDVAAHVAAALYRRALSPPSLSDRTDRASPRVLALAGAVAGFCQKEANSMLKRFERLTGNLEAAIVGAVLLLIVIAYVVSQFMGDS